MTCSKGANKRLSKKVVRIIAAGIAILLVFSFLVSFVVEIAFYIH
jgi:hypothetical protein